MITIRTLKNTVSCPIHPYFLGLTLLLEPSVRDNIFRTKNLEGQDLEPGNTSNKPLVIIRNTNIHAPSLTLNVHSHAQLGRRELYMVALFGGLLQLGVLVYSGFSTYHPSLKLPKDGHQVAGYAFTCTAAGTLLLVAGMVLCCHVVESSTSETRYRPVAGRQARVVWLQRSGTVSDQAFESFGIFPAGPRNIITASQRAAKRNELLAVVGTVVSLGGYIVQFIGLRGMHWSASVAQLGAIGVMTILRAWVRRGLARLPASQPLVPEHELDWLAITLGADHSKAPWVDLSRVTRNSQSKPWAEGGWDWGVSGVQDPANCHKLQPYSYTAEASSKAQVVLKVRRELGKLADWHGPASAEAISLARAIEVVMDTMDPLFECHTGELSWSMDVCGEPIYFRLEREAGSWKAFSDELEAALSLWLYSVHAVEQGKRDINKTTREPQWENQSSSSTERLGSNLRNRRPMPRKHPATANDDAWLRAKGTIAKRSLQLLGSSSPALRRDLHWWMPDGAIRIVEIEKDRPTNEAVAIEVETHRIVGFASGMDYGSPSRFRRFKISPNSGLAERVACDNDITQNGSAEMLLAAESYTPLKSLLAYYMFCRFMWVAAKRLRKPLSSVAEIRLTDSDGEGSSPTWRSFAFHNAQLSKMAQDIENTGIGTLEEAYLSIIPPLSVLSLLPDADPVIHLTRKHAQAQEKLGHWDAAGEAYLWLFKTSTTFPPDRSIVAKATALLMEHLWVVTRTIELKTTIDKLARPDSVIHKLMELETRLYNELQSADRLVLAKLRGLYQIQQRSWRPDLPQDTTVLRGEDTTLQFTTLHWSATWQAVTHQTLDDAKTDVNAKDAHDKTPLHYAAVEGGVEDISLLLKYGADINAQDVRDLTPLHLACHHNKAKTVEYLLRQGAKIGMQDSCGFSALHHAAIQGHKEVAQVLIKASADVNLNDRFGYSPLLWAAYTKHLDLIPKFRIIVNMRRRDNHGRTLLHLALHQGDDDPVGGEEVVAGFIDAFISILEAKDSRGGTPLYRATAQGNTTAVRLLLDRGANIEARDQLKETPLHAAATRGDPTMIQLLADRGADVNATDISGETPLHIAARRGHTEAVQVLIDRGANVEVRNVSIETPLHKATRRGHTELARLLINRGANPDAKNVLGETPLHNATRMGHVEVVQLLLDKGVDMESRAISSRTPLHSAALLGRRAVVQLLLSRGADKEAKDMQGKTPLQSLPGEAARQAIAELLEMAH